MKKVAIIGAGVTGLTLGYKLLKDNFDVTVYEANKEVAGQLYAFPIENAYTEIYYHHTFMSDANFINLCKELKIDDRLEWLDSSMAYYTDDVQYAFGTPLELLNFKPLSFINKIKFVLSVLRLQSIKDISYIQRYSAKEWFEQKGYDAVWNTIWEPLFKSKFGEISDEISLVWLWDKLIKRGKSRGKSKEKLCYMKGSFFQLAKSLEKEIIDKNGNILLDTKVNSIIKQKDGFEVVEENDTKSFDIVVSTLSTDNHAKLYDFSNNYLDYLNNYKYQSAICALLVLDKKFSNFYWTNVGDFDLSFGGIIEHTNFVGTKRYNGKNIVYISRYLDKKNEFYNLSNDEILDRFCCDLSKVNKDFKKESIIKSYIFKQDDAQPIVKKGYIKPDFKTELENFYWLSTHHVYPHDRGIEYSVESANILSKYINRK